MGYFEASSPMQLLAIASSFIPNELTPAQKANRDWDLAKKLDRRGDEYQAEGNLAMAKICWSKALGAANRAVQFEAEAKNSA